MSKGGMYWRARRDASEPEIVETFRDLGCSVTALSAKGVPDLLVGYEGVWHLVECKTGKAKLSDDQVEWQRAQSGEPVQIARTAEQARLLVRHWTAAATAYERARNMLIRYDEQGGWTGTNGGEGA